MHSLLLLGIVFDVTQVWTNYCGTTRILNELDVFCTKKLGRTNLEQLMRTMFFDLKGHPRVVFSGEDFLSMRPLFFSLLIQQLRRKDTFADEFNW